MSKRSPEDLDTDHTDELPVLLETVGLEEAVEPLFEARREDTSEHTALFAPVDAFAAEQVAALKERAEQVPALEAQIRVLTDSARDLEKRLADKDRRLADLDGTLASLRRATDDSAGAESRLATQLAVRDAQLAELTATLERVERDAAATSAELVDARTAADAARRDTEALRAELAAKPAPEASPVPGAQDLREDYAGLVAYIEGRRSWWNELEVTNARLAARVASLEQDLKSGAKRVAAAESFAERESRRAVALRAELVEYARRVEAAEREQRAALGPTAPGEPMPPAVEVAPRVAAAIQAPIVSAPPPDSPPVLEDAVESAAPAIEAIAQLEAEVEYKRQQVAAQLVELRDREQRLRAATSELGSLRTELDESRANVARLEKTLADKDRALEARDARIATLHEELKQRAAAPDKRSPTDFALPSIEPAARGASHDGPTDTGATPLLICLTGDAPRRFALTKKTITVGRGPQCDLQILTHFVSREHARLTFSGGATMIEDLGSRNGVFVNSVRVDRRNLQQGDLVTIGETQFRFVESMAH